MSRQRFLIVVIVVLGIFLFSAFSIYLFVKETGKKNLPVVGQVYDFTLVNEKNEPFSLSALEGKVWIVDFFFTTCSDICPMMTKNMVALNRTFEGVKEVRLVSISVNPEFDSTAVLAAYAQKQGARDHWIFLTGERETIKDLAVKSFKLGSIEEPVFHSSYFSLVDQHGLIRGYYDGTKADEINRLYRDSVSLLKRKP